MDKDLEKLEIQIMNNLPMGHRKMFSYFAAGCSTSSKRKIVAPSFVIVTSPMSSTIILSKPTGPNELFTMFEIAAAAITTETKYQSIKEKY